MKTAWGMLLLGLTVLNSASAHAASSTEPKLEPIWNQDMSVEIQERHEAGGGLRRAHRYTARLRVFEDMNPPKGINRLYTCEVTLPDNTGSPDRLKFPCTFNQDLCACSSVKFTPAVAREFLTALMGAHAPAYGDDQGDFEIAYTHLFSFGALGGMRALDKRHWLKTWAGFNRTGTDNADL